MSKEPKLFGERPCDMDAIALLNSFKAQGEGELYTSDIQLIAKALRAAAEKAWDEGAEYVLEATGEVGPCDPAVDTIYDTICAANPYRLPSEPAKGDGNGG